MSKPPTGSPPGSPVSSPPTSPSSAPALPASGPRTSSVFAPKTGIVILEQGVPGYGGSGRNAVIVSPSIDHSPESAVAHFGRDEADRLAKIGLQNIDELATFAGNDSALSG